ncbi:MAG TPA: DEAD/DEAH box helicase [Planctomycetes bacterium]|nr:DEAD/DEAH box helicase [Fuerstiella sp.]HIK94921.1 DEAD/DEAH box helicase [Planctomycetota bacterium]
MKTFEELQLIAPLQRALTDEKYEIPTPIQAQTVPAALQGRDILGCAQTGTGKTAAFALPILNQLGKQNLKAQPNRPLVLVLAPTRELAIQIEESFATYGRHLRLRQVLVYGGVKQGNQVRALKRGAHILVATPGRLIDLMNQGHITLDQLEVFVLDEADRMLDMGFLPDLRRIISHLPDERQSLFFSATMPPKITQLSKRLLRTPVSVNVTPKTTSVERIEQKIMFVERTGKQSLLRQILTAGDVDRAIVFTKTKRGANVVAEKLERSGIKALAIHGNKSQNARQRALEAFRQNQIQVLVATDVAARGIDIDGITHVINFDLPIEPEAYVHRIGRTGRAGAEGIALSFCSATEGSELHAIERLIGQKIPLAEGQIQPQWRPEQKGRSSSGRRNGHSQNGTSQGAGSQRFPRRRSSGMIGAADKAKPKRRRRNGQQTRQHVRQTD